MLFPFVRGGKCRTERLRPDALVSAGLLVTQQSSPTFAADEPRQPAPRAAVRACQLAMGRHAIIIPLHTCSLWMWSKAGMRAPKQGVGGGEGGRQTAC